MTEKKKLVLVADDFEGNAELVARLVEVTTAFETISVTDGHEALVKARERMPDVAILDINMPRIDGIETARIMREEFAEKRPLLIALTGIDSVTDLEFSALFDHVMRKPLELDKLLDHLQGV